MFGVLLGKLIASTIINPSKASVLDWLLIVIGILVVILHYSTDRKETTK